MKNIKTTTEYKGFLILKQGDSYWTMGFCFPSLDSAKGFIKEACYYSQLIQSK